MDGLETGRALHVAAVVIWIGGVAFVTLALLPVLGRGGADQDWFARFTAIERRFAWIARIALLVAGGSGFYMIVAMDGWDRFTMISYWWMHAMVVVWVIFALMLFVIEPLGLDRILETRANRNPGRTHALVSGAHWVLLVFSLIATFGAVAGRHGAFLS